MFLKFKSKIMIFMTLVTVVCFFTVSLLCYSGARAIVLANCTSLAQDYVGQQWENILLFQKLIENAARSVSELVGAPGGTSHTDDITDRLDRLQATNLSIRGVSLYRMDGSAYFSSNVFTAPILAQLKTNPAIAGLLAGHADGLWTYRASDLPIYGSDVFTSTTSVISYVARIQNPQGDTAGILVVDLIPQSVLDYFQPHQNFPFELEQAYLFDNGHYVKAGADTSPDSGQLNEVTSHVAAGDTAVRLHDKSQLLLVKSWPETSMSFAVVLSLHPLINSLHLFLCCLLIVTLVMVCLVATLYRKLSNSIFERLSTLYHNIKGQSVSKREAAE